MNYKLYTLCLKKVPTVKLSVAFCQILTDFQNFCTAGERKKLATKSLRHYPSHLRHVATLPWEIKNSNFLQIFRRYGRKCKQIAFLSPLTLRVVPRTDCKYFFQFTVVLFIYFCDQFVSPEIRHSKRHCRVSHNQQDFDETFI